MKKKKRESPKTDVFKTLSDTYFPFSLGSPKEGLKGCFYAQTLALGLG